MCKYWISDEHNGDGDCELETIIECDSCKFGGGKLNPFAKKYQRTNANIQQQAQADSPQATTHEHPSAKALWEDF